jgi:pectin methylesterase-like acyl-CoA thioesterase
LTLPSKHSASRQYIAILPGEYEGTVYVPPHQAALPFTVWAKKRST